MPVLFNTKKQPHYWLTLIVCVVIAGCGKADIKSDCNVKGNGDFHCTYHNKGKAKGSLCEHIVLKPLRDTSSVEFLHKSNIRRSAVGKLKLSGKFGLNDDLINFLAYSAYEDDYEKKDKWREFTVSEQALIKELDNKIRTIISTTPAWGDETKFSSDEICSGIVEAGDVREVNGLASFDGLPPRSVCFDWPNKCVMSTVSSDLLETMKKSVMSFEQREEKIKAAIEALATK